MKSKAVQFLEAHLSGERSTFVDDAKCVYSNWKVYHFLIEKWST